LFTADCGRNTASVSAPSTTASDPTMQESIEPIIVSAAASTKEVMEELAEQFEQERGVPIHINLGGSNTLAAQIINGAPVDLFLSASTEWITAVSDAGLVQQHALLLLNSLVIVTPRNNPAAVQQPGDLLGQTVKHVALAEEAVPAGKYADQALRTLNLLEPLTTSQKIVRGHDVRVALSYVEHGEAEAGIVYATDAKASGSVEVVYTFDAATHEAIIYELAMLKHAQSNSIADDFYRLLLSDKADQAFMSRGFQRPATPSNQTPRS
jgi:molybdate transport system substrate-binding protein